VLRRTGLLGLVLAATLSSSADESVIVPGPCTLLNHVRAVFVGTVTEERPQGQYRFRVDEKFKGVKGDYFDVEWRPKGVNFQVGKQYLVFVVVWPFDDGKHLVAAPWGQTRELKYAQAVLEQLRAEKNGKRNASVYGTLLQAPDPLADDDNVRPLAGVAVRLQSKEKSFETTTDERGAYAFERLPGATYRFSADLSPNLQLELVKPFELPRGTCYQNDITIVPAGKP
jgi:hypothetical protein